jgi:HEAT repeat protein
MSHARRVPIIVLFFAILAAVLLTWQMRKEPMTSDSPENASAAQAVHDNATRPATGDEEADSLTPGSLPPNLFTAEEISVQKLQDLLDDESTHAEALEKALVLAEASIRERVAAIDALRWLGGRRAMYALLKLRNESYSAIADEAGHALNHLLTENLYTGGIKRDDFPDDGLVILDEGLYDDELSDEEQKPDQALWLQAIESADDENTRDALLIVLAAHPVEEAVPILLQLLDSANPEVREAVKEHLQSITGGEEIITRQQGEEWLAKNISNTDDADSSVDPDQAPE